MIKEYKKENREIYSNKVLVDDVIRGIKVFRILSEKYRNRRNDTD
ncbi:MAG: hypothetical protein QM536_01540 [Chitinophagaceae bacterium]|nr:hypothetical protein [Chitinophagaceae bacterium]